MKKYNAVGLVAAMAVLLAAVLVASSRYSTGDKPVDIRSVKADLVVPAMERLKPAAGKRVRQIHPDYARTDVYHTLYLPTDWRPGKTYPVIVEFAGNGPYKNQYGDISTGLVEGSKLGYGISAGKGFIWLCLPYLNDKGTANVTQWWGDKATRSPRPTVAYCKKVVPWICKKYGGDPRRVLLVGFSRGAIACNFIGLHDDEIARLWRAFVPYSHYDGVFPRWGYPAADRKSALVRLRRLGRRPQFICHETSSGRLNLAATKSWLKSTGISGSFTFVETGFRNHNDAWTLRPSPARRQLRKWVRDVVGSIGE